jgi:hypothetical protein
MSRKWKITIGVVIAAVVVAGITLAVWGAVTFRNRVQEYGWEPRAHKWGPEATTQLEIRLVDDDGDGIPDRGVIEVPADLPLGPSHGFHFGRGFGPHFGRSPVLSLSKGFGAFPIVGGLFRLAFLALLIGLAVAFFRHRSRGSPSPAKGQEV